MCRLIQHTVFTLSRTWTIFKFFKKKKAHTGIGGIMLGNMVLSLGSKRKPWSRMFSGCLLQNDEELRGHITGSSCGQKTKEWGCITSRHKLRLYYFTLICLFPALSKLRLDFGIILLSMTSRANDFRTFFIGGRC